MNNTVLVNRLRTNRSVRTPPAVINPDLRRLLELGR
jgi:hypothetical protein